MKARIPRILEFLRTSYWFLPAVMSFAAFGLAVLMLVADRRWGTVLPVGRWWLYGGDSEGARTVLSVISGSMISVTSVVFSITIVTLTLAAGQFGSRILRNFMRDRGNQITLGAFIATFIYALVVLRTIRGADDSVFVPALSVTVGMLLAFFSVGVLIYFIHHVASAIQADSVIKSIAAELIAAIDRLYPETIGAPAGDPPDDELPSEAPAARVRAVTDDYLQSVDLDGLMRVAVERDLVVVLRRRPGDFVARSAVLADVWFRTKSDPDVARELGGAFAQGGHRTMQQDAEFGILQLVEIAVRALSPGINDPFTAITCVDRLGAALRRLATREFPARARADRDGTVRLIADSTSFAGFINAAFDQIRQNAGGSVAVLIRVLESLETIAEDTVIADRRSALRAQAALVLEAGMEHIDAEADRVDLRERYATLMDVLDGPHLHAAAS